jgi:hypothetical protein
MKIDEIKEYLFLNFNSDERFLLLAHTIEKVIPSDRHENFLKDCKQIFGKTENKN